MNDRLPLKLRLLATSLHAIVSIPIGIIAIYSLSLLISNSTKYSFECLMIGFYLGLPSIFILLVIACIQWLITKRIHPFVDRTGRSVLNYTLNMSLLMLCLVFALIATCGMLDPNKTSRSYLYFEESSLGIKLILLNCIAIAYSLNSVVSGIFTWKGLQFKNRLIYPFLRDI
jgi:uncharacterized Tic20 family protein